MASGRNIRTYFEGTWHDGDALVMRASRVLTTARRSGMLASRKRSASRLPSPKNIA